MASIKDISVGTSKFHKISPESIEIEEGFNCRQDYGDIATLARQIQDQGLIQPLIGHMNGDKFRVTDGHRRTKAIQHILKNGGELPHVSVILEPQGTSAASRIAKQITTTGKNLTPMEQSDVIAKLSDLGLKQKEIAAETGLTQPYVSSLLKINKLPQLGKDMVHAGIISSTLVIQLVNQCKGDEEMLYEKLLEIKDHFEASGEKVTMKKIKPVPTKKEESEEESVADSIDEPESNELEFNEPESPKNTSLKDTIKNVFDNESENGLEFEDYILFIKECVSTLDSINVEDEDIQNKIISLIKRSEMYIID